MVCLARKPLCAQCPVQSQCVALRQGVPENYPRQNTQIDAPIAGVVVVAIARCCRAGASGATPLTGIWPGLHCLPMYAAREDVPVPSALKSASHIRELPPFLHILTHRDLHLHPVIVEVNEPQSLVHEGAWFSRAQWPSLGLPAPIRKLLESVQ